MKRLPQTASGPDGLPYCAWQEAGEESVETLWQVVDKQRSGETPPHELNDSVTLFIPKGEPEGDHVQIIRAGGDNRPLSLKNSDNKIATAVVNDATSAVVADGAHETQNGFKKGRQLLQNVVDLDSFARIFGMFAAAFNITNCDPCKLKIAILAFFDFAAAFPSVAHEWIFICLDAANAPDWLINYIRGLYSRNDTYHINSFGKIFLYSIWAGVLQGCPLSATLFVFAINPFLVHFEIALRGRYEGVTRACADDVGICLTDYRSLMVVYKVFALAKELANLCLKPKNATLSPSTPKTPISKIAFGSRKQLVSGSQHTSQIGKSLW